MVQFCCQGHLRNDSMSSPKAKMTIIILSQGKELEYLQNHLGKSTRQTVRPLTSTQGRTVYDKGYKQGIPVKRPGVESDAPKLGDWVSYLISLFWFPHL